MIGHETLAIVEETGANVTQFKPGDLVTATVRRPAAARPARRGRSISANGINTPSGGSSAFMASWPSDGSSISAI